MLIRQNGQERNIPPSEVAQIDFAGDGRSPAGAGGAAAHPARNGQTVDGRLMDIGARSRNPVRRHAVRSAAVQSGRGRPVVLNPTGAAAAAGGNKPGEWHGTLGRRQTTTFTIAANQPVDGNRHQRAEGDTLEGRVAGEIEMHRTSR
jgi:hypothetical protein